MFMKIQYLSKSRGEQQYVLYSYSMLSSKINYRYKNYRQILPSFVLFSKRRRDGDLFYTAIYSILSRWLRVALVRIFTPRYICLNIASYFLKDGRTNKEWKKIRLRDIESTVFCHTFSEVLDFLKTFFSP